MVLQKIVARLTAGQLDEVKQLIQLKDEGRLCVCGEIIPIERIEFGLLTCKKCAPPTQILRVREGIGGGNLKLHTELILVQ